MRLIKRPLGIGGLDDPPTFLFQYATGPGDAGDARRARRTSASGSWSARARSSTRDELPALEMPYGFFRPGSRRARLHGRLAAARRPAPPGAQPRPRREGLGGLQRARRDRVRPGLGGGGLATQGSALVAGGSCQSSSEASCRGSNHRRACVPTGSHAAPGWSPPGGGSRQIGSESKVPARSRLRASAAVRFCFAYVRQVAVNAHEFEWQPHTRRRRERSWKPEPRLIQPVLDHAHQPGRASSGSWGRSTIASGGGIAPQQSASNSIV